MSELLIISLAVVGYLYLTSKLQLLRLLCGSPLRLAMGDLVEKSEVPPGFLNHYNHVSECLKKVGFEHSHYEKRPDIAASVETPHWIVVMRHPTARSYAEIAVPPAPDIANRVTVIFRTFHDSVDLITQSERYVILDKSTSNVHINTIEKGDLIEQWQSHVEFLKSKETSGELCGGGQFPQPEEYLYRIKGSQWRYLDNMTDNGTLVKDAQEYRTSFKAAVNCLVDLPKQQKTDAAARLANFDVQYAAMGTSGSEMAALEANAFYRQEQLLENCRFNTKVKSILFLTSIVAFSVIIGMLFSWSFLIALFPVLLFHELGHLMAMKLLGYRDLQILFLPLGAVALGRESESYRPWKEVIVLLAGPVPGIMLAIAAMLFWPEQPGWVQSLVWMSLILNYFNLLPLMPLDGGRLLHIAAFSKSKVASLLFKAASAFMFALGAWFMSDSILAILAVAMGYFCFAEVVAWNSLRSTKKNYDSLTGIENPIERAFAALSSEKSLFNEKYSLIRQLVPEKSVQVPSLTTQLVTLFVYIGVLVAPVVGVYGSMFHYFDSEHYEQVEVMQNPEYWRTAIASEADPEEKADLMLSGAIWISEPDDVELKKSWLESAVNIAMVENNNELFSRSMLDLINFQIENNAINEAIHNYWSWVARPNADIDYLTSATQTMVWIEDDESAYPFVARSLSYAANSEESWEIMNAYLALAYNHLERNQKDYALYFASLAGDTIMSSSELDAYAGSQLAEFFVAYGDLEKAVSILEVTRRATLQDSDHFEQEFVTKELGWLALVQGDFASAEILLNEFNHYSSLSNVQRADSIGFLGRLILGDDGVDELVEYESSDWEYRLVLAHQQNNWTSYQKALSVFIDEYDGLNNALTWHREMLSTRKRDRSSTLRHQMIVNALEHEMAI